MRLMETSSRQLCEDIFLLQDCFKCELDRLAEANSLTRAQVFVLYRLYRHGDSLAMGQVAEAMHCDASNVTGIVDRLVSGDFVIRKENERDRRAKSLHLTDRGRQVIDAVVEALANNLARNLDDAERSQLHALLRKACQ